jgi:general secretion pathway protein I
MTNKHRQKGMTLLEVLVALVIFSVGCMAVVRTAGQQIRHLTVLEEKMVAGWVADNQLSLLSLGKLSATETWQQGVQEMAGRQWHWRYRGQQTTENGLYAVDIEISDSGTFSYPLVSLRTWMTSR